MIYGTQVRLRAVEREDAPRFVQWFNDPEVREHISLYRPLSLAQEEKWIEQQTEPDPPNHVFAIETNDGVHIGVVGLHDINWKNRSAEFGIVIGEKGYWGQGYGTDATRTILNYAFGELNLHRIHLRVDADNPRAIRCYEKCDFQHEGTLRDVVFSNGNYKDQFVMSILQPEFELA